MPQDAKPLKSEVTVAATPSNNSDAVQVEMKKSEAGVGSKNGPATTVAVVPYSSFTLPQKRAITALIGCSMFFSPFTANIYFPCIEQLQIAMGVTSGQINLTITTYLIIQGVAPAFFGDLADNRGRRPVYILTFIVYVIANIALAIQTSYPALLVLRGLQSFGCSATVALGYGVIADVATPAERGSMLGPAMIATNVGPSFGPLIGGIVAAKAGWRWTFWLLVIHGGTYLCILVLFFSETGRSIVKNGSIPTRPWNRPLATFHRRDQPDTVPKRELERHRMILPNPLTALLIVFHRDTASVLLVSAVNYAAYYCIQASIPSIFVDIYHLDDLQIGLCYLAIGTGVIIGGYCNGKLMDLNYRKMARTMNLTIDKVMGDDLVFFPIEKARAQTSWLLISASTMVMVACGWLLECRVHISGPLISQFLQGLFRNLSGSNVSPRNTSTAAAAGNITRCALSAAAVAVMDRLLHSIGRGWFFTLFALASGAFSVVSTVLLKYRYMEWCNACWIREAQSRNGKP